MYQFFRNQSWEKEREGKAYFIFYVGYRWVPRDEGGAMIASPSCQKKWISKQESIHGLVSFYIRAASG